MIHIYTPYHSSIKTQNGNGRGKFSFEGMITENYFWHCERIDCLKEHNSKTVVYPQSMSKSLS